MLNLIFHDSSIFSPTKKPLQSSEQHLFKHLPWFPTEIIFFSNNYILLVMYPGPNWGPNIRFPINIPRSPESWTPEVRTPRSKIPRGRGPHLAYMRHRKVNDQTSRRNHRLKKKPTGEEPHGTKMKKNLPPGFNFYYAVFVKVNYRSYTWHGDVTWMKLGCMKLGWILK